MDESLDALIDRLRARAGRSTGSAEPDLRPPATSADLDTVGTVLGVGLPLVLRRVLRRVSDGGFGPGRGLYGTADLVRVTGRCRRDGEALGGWPLALLPVAELEDGLLACVRTDDPDAPVHVVDLRRAAADGCVAASAAAPSLAAWLDEWASADEPAP